MSPDESAERELGILIGKVDGIDQRLAEMRDSNSREHAATALRLNTIEDTLHRTLAVKADLKAVETHERRIDSLESDRDKRVGGARVVHFIQGALVTAAAVAGFFVGAGGIVN